MIELWKKALDKKPEVKKKPSKALKNYLATGRRKNAVARVFLIPVNSKKEAKIVVNKKKLEDYFDSNLHSILWSPIVATELEGKFKININVKGGGKIGQVYASRHGISRALILKDENLKNILKSKGFLTRDPRKKERKKAGRPGARKKFQFSKR